MSRRTVTTEKKEKSRDKLAEKSGQKPLDPLMGVELTFCNDATKQDIGDDGIKNEKALERYKNFLKNVEGYFKSFAHLDVSEVTAELFDSSKTLENFEVKDLRISFKNDSGKEVFWINITRDPSVIEIQTMPFHVSELENEDSLASAVLDQIFGKDDGHVLGGAAYDDEELSADPKLGGGHINIDAATSGLDNPQAVLELIKLWEVVQSQSGLVVEDPTATRIGGKKRFDRVKDFSSSKQSLPSPDDHSRSLLDEIERAFKVKGGWEKIVKQVAKAYWYYPPSRLFSDKASSNSLANGVTNEKGMEREFQTCLHNSAINIEHLCEDDPKARRVEFREFRAQTSREEILECWKLIQQVLMNIQSISKGFYIKKESEESKDDDKDKPVAKGQATLNPGSGKPKSDAPAKAEELAEEEQESPATEENDKPEAVKETPQVEAQANEEDDEQEQEIEATEEAQTAEQPVEASTPNSSPNPAESVHLESGERKSGKEVTGQEQNFASKVKNPKKHQGNRRRGRK